MPDKTATLHISANEILMRIKGLMADISAVEKEATDAMERIRQDYSAKLAPLQDELSEKEKELSFMMKKNRESLFADEDRVVLDHGILLYAIKDKVTIPRDALAKAIALGLDDAIHIAKTLDRAVIEKWPDERLSMIGATRKPKERYSYEIRH